ncbi:MAG: DMT family transporter [Rhodospirillaceae bacterium]|jgi:drug/metabolite transporter (DMT)-like permease|nr:DMT family transporter [Rhodospirillaceae bacterium]MBT7954851.1 DMT family transporter [Rhodospirillaceae bacterium]
MKSIWNHAYLLMALTAIAWSGNSITARFVNDIVPPIGLSFWRWAAAAPILIIMSWPHLRRDLPMLKQNWLIMLTLSVLAISMYSTLIYQALLTTTAINSFLINASRPTIIVLLSILFFRQGITFVQSIGFVVALLGTFTIILRGEPSHLLTLEFNTGDLWVLAATTVWALYTVLLPKRPKMHPTSFLAITVMLGLVILLPFYIWETIYIKPTPLEFKTVWGVAYLAIISSIFAYLCYNRAVELAGPNKAGQVSYMLPIIGSGFAILLLGESFQFFHAIGLPLIFCGVYLGSKGK